MLKHIWLLFVLVALSCKPNQQDFSLTKDVQDTSNQNEKDTIELGFRTELPGQVKHLFEILKAGRKIHKYNLEQATLIMNAELTSETSFTDSYEADDMDVTFNKSYYRGLKIGSKVFIFKRLDSTGVADNFYQPITWFADSIYQKRSD